MTKEELGRLFDLQCALYRDYMRSLFDDNKEQGKEPEFLTQKEYTLGIKDAILYLNRAFLSCFSFDPSILQIWFSRNRGRACATSDFLQIWDISGIEDCRDICRRL